MKPYKKELPNGDKFYGSVCSARDIDKIKAAVGCGLALSSEMLVLAGGDPDVVIEAAFMSESPCMTKARIINHRLTKLEQELAS